MIGIIGVIKNCIQNLFLTPPLRWRCQAFPRRFKDQIQMLWSLAVCTFPWWAGKNVLFQMIDSENLLKTRLKRNSPGGRFYSCVCCDFWRNIASPTNDPPLASWSWIWGNRRHTLAHICMTQHPFIFSFSLSLFLCIAFLLLRLLLRVGRYTFNDLPVRTHAANALLFIILMIWKWIPPWHVFPKLAHTHIYDARTKTAAPIWDVCV